MRNKIMLLGAVLWIGALSPEIFIDPALGCVFDADGDELGKEEAHEFMEAYFYGGKEAEPELKFKFGILELFNNH